MHCKTLPLLLLSLVAAAGAYAERITVVGSDLLVDALAETFAEIDSESDELEIDLQLEGSALARRDLVDNEADLAILAVPVGQTAPENEFTAMPVAFKVAAIAVNRSNPLTEISIDQLGGIYGRLQSEQIAQWGQLGLTGAWRNRNINPQALRTLDGISLELFRHSVIPEGDLNLPNIGLWESSEQLYLNIRNDDAAIGVLGTPYMPSGLKSVAIVSTDGVPFGPTEDSIFFGDYPLRLPFYLVFKEEDKQRLKPILAKLFSDEMAERLRQHKLVPIPETERRERLLMINLMR